MAFPTGTALLDNFNRANATPIANPPWISNGVFTPPQIVSNVLESGGSGPSWAAYNVNYSIPWGAWIQVVRIDDPTDFSNGFGIRGAIQKDATVATYDQDYTGIIMNVQPADDGAFGGTGQYQLGYGGNVGNPRILDGGELDGGVAVAVNDYFGISAEYTDGPTNAHVRITGWRDHGSGWVEIAHLDALSSDMLTNIPAGTNVGYSHGYIAPVHYSTDYGLDNFGGGALSSISSLTRTATDSITLSDVATIPPRPTTNVLVNRSPRMAR